MGGRRRLLEGEAKGPQLRRSRCSGARGYLHTHEGRSSEEAGSQGPWDRVTLRSRLIRPQPPALLHLPSLLLCAGVSHLPSERPCAGERLPGPHAAWHSPSAPQGKGPCHSGAGLGALPGSWSAPVPSHTALTAGGKRGFAFCSVACASPLPSPAQRPSPRLAGQVPWRQRRWVLLLATQRWQQRSAGEGAKREPSLGMRRAPRVRAEGQACAGGRGALSV